MLALATFYRNIELLFEGVLTTRNTLEIYVIPAGFVRTTGKDKLRVKGISNTHSVTEEIQARLSTYAFSHIDYIEPVTSSFTGKVSIVDSSGVGIPVDTVLYTLPVEMSFTYLASLSPIRGQDEIGTIPADKVVNFVVKFSVVSSLKVNDYLTVQGVTYIVKNCHSINPSHWIIQTVIKEV